jgi:hypothetical protein
MPEKELFPYNLESLFLDWKHKVELKQLGLPHVKKGFKNKFIAIQIDGLSYDMLEKLLHTPQCKFIRSLIVDRHFYVSRYNCGLPADTPSSLAGILYGNRKELIGFRSIDKKRKIFNSFASPDYCWEVERSLSKKKGALDEGSAYTLCFSGGADRTFLTMSTLTKKAPLKRIKESNIVILMLLNPFIVAKVLISSVAELLLELYDSLASFLHRIFIVKEKKIAFHLAFPFKRFFFQGVAMEMQRIGAVLDMKRGVPRIYTNFHAYDDVLHRRGLNSKAALRTLKQTDRLIKKIYNRKPEDYDFYILSDHGMEAAVPFDKAYDETLQALLERLTDVETQSMKDEDRGERMFWAAKRMGYALKYLTGPFRWSLKTMMKALSKSYRKREREAVWKKKEQVFVQASGSFAHIYLTASQQRMTLAGIQEKYPKLIKGLRAHPGIGFFVVKTVKGLKVLGWDGEFNLEKNVSKKGKDFLKRFGKTELLLEQIRELGNKENVGDIIIFGNFHYGKIVSFSDHYACHGGASKKINSPFFLSKQGFDLRDSKSSEAVYEVFKTYL